MCVCNTEQFQQHDVQEFCRVLLDAVEKEFKGTNDESLVARRVFFLTNKYNIKPTKKKQKRVENKKNKK